MKAFCKKIYHFAKKMDFGAECIKAVLTSVFLLVISTAAGLLIFQFSPGEFTDDTLDRYLLRQIAEEVGVPCEKDTITILERLYSEDTEANQMVLCGNYRNNSDSNWTGRFVFVFERKARSFWNAVVGTKANYEVAFFSVSFDEGYVEDTLECVDCRYEDVDVNDTKEIVVTYTSHFADRISHAMLVLQNENKKWQIISPDFSTIQKDAEEEYGEGAMVLLDEFIFSGQNETATVYGLSHGGTIYKLENPIVGGNDWLYCITVNDGTKGLLFSDTCAYVMMRLTDSGMHKDQNWNQSRPLFLPREDTDAQEKIVSCWGHTIGGTVFYTDDIR